MRDRDKPSLFLSVTSAIFCQFLRAENLTVDKTSCDADFGVRAMATTAAVIQRKVEKGDGDRLWTYKDFAFLPPAAVAKTLSRLAESGVISRVCKGVYYRSKTTRFGDTKPDMARVFARMLDRKDVGWKPGGLAVWNALGLTTQVPATSTFVVNRRVQVALPRATVRMRVVSSVEAVSIEERAALDALRDLRHVPDTTPAATIRKLTELCREGRLSFSRMVRASRREPPRVRALLGLIGTLLGENTAVLMRLHHSLNPTTKFKLQLATDFPAASDWGIR